MAYSEYQQMQKAQQTVSQKCKAVTDKIDSSKVKKICFKVTLMH